MAKQRTSVSIQNVGDEAYLIEFLRKLKPTSVGVINDSNLLKRILAAVPEIEYGWIRFYREDDGALWMQGEAPLNWLLDQWYSSGLQGNPRAFLYVSNEPAPGWHDIQNCANWHAWAGAELRKRGIRAVLMNAQPAVFLPESVSLGWFDALLRELSDGFHILGWHEYGGPIPPVGANGGNKYDMLDKAKSQPNYWPTFEQVRYGDIYDNWLIGRLYWWDDRAKLLGLNAPLKLITELGQDRLDVYDDVYKELERRYGVPAPHVTLRGFSTYRPMYQEYYREAYPTDTFENAVIAFMRWYDTIYDPTILGMNYFVWSPDKYDWDIQFGFDYAGERVLHQYLWAWTRELEKVTYPTPDDNLGTPVVISSAANPRQSVRFRAAPEPTAQSLGLILAPVNALMFTHQPDAEMFVGGTAYKMRQFKIGDQYGWAAVDLLVIEPKIEEPTDPIIPIRTSKLDAVRERVAGMKNKVNELMAEVNNLATMLNVLHE